MFEFHGWAVLEMSPETNDKDHGSELLNAFSKLKDVIALTGVATHFHLHDIVNDMYSMTVSGLRNHRQDEVIGVFEWIAKQAPGSYGLLYIQNDEARRGEEHAYSFRVYRLVRGSLSDEADPFLSPRIPVLEDG